MSARQYGSSWWVVDCDGDACTRYVAGLGLLMATSRAHRSGWVTRPVTVDIDGVPRQRVEHYCPTHKGVAG